MHTTIEEVATAFAAITETVRPEQLALRTPCEQYTVEELLTHLSGVFPASARAARKEPQADAQPAPSDPASVAESARRAAASWAEPSALDGTTEFGPGAMPAEFAAAITLQELALHGWDLATATGRPFRLGENTGLLVLKVVEQLAEQARSNGAYGPAVEVRTDAPAFDRALAASGRSPEWSA